MNTQPRRTVIVEVPGADPARDRHLFAGGGAAATELVLIPATDAALAIARESAAAGVPRIELCGGMGVAWQARTAAVVGARVRVGAVSFGFESLQQVARVQSRFSDGEAVPTLLLLLLPGSDPRQERYAYANAALSVVAVPDAEAAAAEARRALEQGIGLIELYGELTPAIATQVIHAVQARIPVGVVGYAAQDLGGDRA
ncbi:DUF6506 family protein [Lysobacter silvisoli]|uniref:Uncharacterized protein n=1 Tax=Lysobacter silvisoli TaxID=2293254 RepID=A0A371JXD2_9GAMM|nr:DUF6506 family protein [Lysobacter silvisoli]RDZ26313.1 hypothetical protein DX914_18805 [Lysobacter silvisoli]